jgi:hypothetical protein
MYRAPGIEGEHQKPAEEMSTVEEEAYSSFENCGRACEEDGRCFQYTYSNQTCSFSWFFRLGHRRVPEDGIRFESGWDLAKIARYEEENTCSSTTWL